MTPAEGQAIAEEVFYNIVLFYFFGLAIWGGVRVLLFATKNDDPV
jgi:hypothetical protein